jgi:hypothetical protein
MNEIQHDLQTLTENLESLTPGSTDFGKQKQSIIIKTERLKKEFRENLIKLQIRQSITTHTVPSDDVTKNRAHLFFSISKLKYLFFSFDF